MKIKFIADKTLPVGLFGYWLLNDDFMFFGNYGNFSAVTKPGIPLNFFMFFKLIFDLVLDSCKII